MDGEARTVRGDRECGVVGDGVVRAAHVGPDRPDALDPETRERGTAARLVLLVTERAPVRGEQGAAGVDERIEPVGDLVADGLEIREHDGAVAFERCVGRGPRARGLSNRK